MKKVTKISIYRAVVLPTLLYSSETWVAYSHHLRFLERFHQRCLRSILNIHWSDYVTNVEVLQQAGITSIKAMLLKTPLRWAGHVSRMEAHRLTRALERMGGETNHCPSETCDARNPPKILRRKCQTAVSLATVCHPLHCLFMDEVD